MEKIGLEIGTNKKQKFIQIKSFETCYILAMKGTGEYPKSKCNRKKNLDSFYHFL